MTKLNKDPKKNNVLWEGKVSIRGSLSFVKTRYALVSKKGIIVRKNENEDSQVIEEFKKDEIISVEFPRFGATEAIVTGFKGFIVKYNKAGKKKTLSFWAKGFGAYPDKKEMDLLVKAMAFFTGKKYSEVKDTVEAYSFMKYIILSVSIIAGYLIGGFIGILLMGIFSYIALKVYENKSLSEDKRNLFSIGIITGGYCITFFVFVVIGFIIGILRSSL